MKYDAPEYCIRVSLSPCLHKTSAQLFKLFESHDALPEQISPWLLSLLWSIIAIH